MPQKTKWGSALLPAPTVAAAGTRATQNLSSPRPSAVPCPLDPILADGHPHGPAWLSGLSRKRDRPSWLRVRSCSVAVPDHMGLAGAGAVAAVCAFPRALPLRACFLGRPGHRSHQPGREALLLDETPEGQGSGCSPLRVLPHPLPPCIGFRLRRARLASGRRFGIRNRLFGPAIRRSQSAPQHAESGFRTSVSSRFDWELFS